MATFTKTYAVDIATHFPGFPYAKSFQRIQALLDDKTLVTQHLTELNKQVKTRFDQNKSKPNYTVAQAMYDILRETEIKSGFNKEEVYYLQGVLSADQFKTMILGKRAFLDPFVTPKHGAESHRIQWWIVAQDMGKNEKLYDDADPATLFASTFDPKASKGSNDNIWYHTFDALQGKCDHARAPESLKEFFTTGSTFSSIKDAEALQMKWDTTVKMTYAKYTSLGPAKVNIDKNWEVKRLGMTKEEEEKEKKAKDEAAKKAAASAVKK